MFGTSEDDDIYQHVIDDKRINTERDFYPFFKGDNDYPNSEVQINEWTERFLKSIEWKCFEDLCARIFEEIGYVAITTNIGPDGGIDINLYRKDSGSDLPYAIVQCKAWNSYKVGVKAIRELFGVMHSEKAEVGYFITSGKYTKDARKFADDNKIKLVDGKELLEMILALPEDKQQSLIEYMINKDFNIPTCPKCGVKWYLDRLKKVNGSVINFGGARNFLVVMGK